MIPVVSKPSGSNMHLRQVGSNHVFVVASGEPGGDPGTAAAGAYAQIASALREGGLEIVQERIFGSLSAKTAIKAARRKALQSQGIRYDELSTYVEGRPTWGEGFAGVIVRAVTKSGAGEGVRRICDGDKPAGRSWGVGDTKYILLQNVQGTAAAGEDNTPAAQARRAMERADRLLRENGGNYRGVIRTWFYLSRILDWYGEFNAVRNAKYREFGVLPVASESAVAPASTGIRAELSGGAACSLDLLAAISPQAQGQAVRMLSNPRQSEAYGYGSAFSRGAVIETQGDRLIQISGTAAIDEAGNSLYRGDVRAQTRCTLEKVLALLQPAGASLADITAATLFVKRGEDADAVREVLTKFGLEPFPAVMVVADVCREELLFEIDAEALVTSPMTR